MSSNVQFKNIPTNEETIHSHQSTNANSTISNGRRYDLYNRKSGRALMGACFGLAIAISVIVSSGIACSYVQGDLSEGEPFRFFCYFFGVGFGGLTSLVAITAFCSCVFVNSTPTNIKSCTKSCLDDLFPTVDSGLDCTEIIQEDEESQIGLSKESEKRVTAE